MKTWTRNLRWRLRLQAKIVRWNRCCVRREAQLLMGRRLLRRCISLRTWVFMEGTFEAPTASTESLKTSNIHNPGLHFLRKALFKLLAIYKYTVYIFLGKPKPEEAVYNNQVACTCEDIEFSERSTSRGCKIGRQRVQVLWWTDQRSHRIILGSKVRWPQTLKVLGHHQRHWQSESGPFGNWKRGGVCLLPSFVDQNKTCQLQGRQPSNVPAHGKQTNKHENNLFLQMVRSSKAVKLEVWSDTRNILRSLVGPYSSMMLKFFFFLSWLGQEGSVQPMAGPRGDDPSSNYSGPKRNGSYAIFEIKWGNAKSALHPAKDTFLHKSRRTWRPWHVQGWLQQDLVFVMSAMKMQVSDMQSNVLPLCSMNACIRWPPLVMPTRWHTKRAANNSTFRIACGLFLVGQNWADNGYIHEECYASRDVKSENLPHCAPCAFEVFEGTAWWEGWCGRGHQKEDY